MAAVKMQQGRKPPAGDGAHTEARAWLAATHRHGRELDELQRLIDTLWNNPGDVFQDWRRHHRPGTRMASGELDERLTQALVQLEALRTQAAHLGSALAALPGMPEPLEDEAIQLGRHAPGSPGARLATARLLVQSGIDELVARHRARVVQVYRELSQEKRRQIALVQASAALTQAWRALQACATRFADLARLSDPIGRDPLLAGGRLLRVASLVLAGCALLGAVLAARRGTGLGLAGSIGAALVLLLLTAYSRRAAARFRVGLQQQLVRMDEHLSGLEQRLQGP